MVLEKLKDNKIVAVIRAKTKKEGKDYADACIRGGIKSLEFTYSIPNVCELIKEYSKEEGLLVGVGSVLSEQMALDAIDKGSKYVVSPGYHKGVSNICKEKGIPYLPGCMTVTEIMEAMDDGNKMIKLFPGDLFGAKFVKMIKAPIPNIDIMPTGGVTIDNVKEWFENGVSCVGVGSSLINGSLENIENTARKFIKVIEEIYI